MTKSVSYQDAPEPMRQAGPPMGAPVPMQIQEQVKYVEIVPNEGIPWKVLNGVTFLIAMFLLSTPAVISFANSADVFNNGFPGTSAFGWLKGPNEYLEQSSYGPLEGAAEFPEPFSSSTEADQIVYPAMGIIRKSSGEDIDSASGSNDEVEEEGEEPAEEETEEDSGEE